MSIQIEVINVANSVVPTVKGSYSVAEITYKNKSYQDKVEAKKIMDFANKEVYNILKNAKFGDVFFIERLKNDRGYWDWVKVSTEEQSTEDNINTGVDMNIASPVKATVSPKSTYETPEERAARQILIVRQSSIASSVALLAANGGKKNTPQEVVDIAKFFEAYVFGKDLFEELEEDVPL